MKIPVKKKNLEEKLEETERIKKVIRTQMCPVCSAPMGDMPGSRDAICKNCGYKDPCCE